MLPGVRDGGRAGGVLPLHVDGGRHGAAFMIPGSAAEGSEERLRASVCGEGGGRAAQVRFGVEGPMGAVLSMARGSGFLIIVSRSREQRRRNALQRARGVRWAQKATHGA